MSGQVGVAGKSRKARNGPSFPRYTEGGGTRSDVINLELPLAFRNEQEEKGLEIIREWYQMNGLRKERETETK